MERSIKRTAPGLGWVGKWLLVQVDVDVCAIEAARAATCSDLKFKVNYCKIEAARAATCSDLKLKVNYCKIEAARAATCSDLKLKVDYCIYCLNE